MMRNDTQVARNHFVNLVRNATITYNKAGVESKGDTIKFGQYLTDLVVK